MFKKIQNRNRFETIFILRSKMIYSGIENDIDIAEKNEILTLHIKNNNNLAQFSTNVESDLERL